MIRGAANLVGKVAGGIAPRSIGAARASGATTFTDALKKSIDEAARMQQDATRAVADLAAGRNNDVSSVMTAVEKSDLAFKTLLAIRAKLMDAYEEIKSINV